jgi:hypothetical protein
MADFPITVSMVLGFAFVPIVFWMFFLLEEDKMEFQVEFILKIMKKKAYYILYLTYFFDFCTKERQTCLQRMTINTKEIR